MQRILILVLMPCFAIAQTTTGSISGKIWTDKGELLLGADIKLVHDPTSTTYFSRTGKNGVYSIHDLLPGGPYSLAVSFSGFETGEKKEIMVVLGDHIQVDLILKVQAATLQAVTVTAKKSFIPKNAAGSSFIDAEKMALLPGRNVYEFLRTVPLAGLLQGNEGAISIAGQNNRYNSFYVDGAINNDVFGLAASGTNGGQTTVPLLPADAIEQMHVSATPYDASIGGFTGGAINAVTRSGTNRREYSMYHFFSNRAMTGKTPTGETSEAKRLDGYFSRIYGVRLQGALRKNRLFYFINIELQREMYTQPFLFRGYRGNSNNITLIDVLANTLRSRYQYDPGSFLDNPEYVNADRLLARFDWNMQKKHSLSMSIRHTYAQRINTNVSDAESIHFSNDGYALFSKNSSLSLELKSHFANANSNKIQLTCTNVRDDREPLLRAFPRVRINDGDGAIFFGTDNSSTINLLTQQNWTLFDEYSFTLNNHLLSIGADLEYNKMMNAFIQNSFGNYTYASLGDFLTGSRPSAYQSGFSMIDELQSDNTAAAASFAFTKIAWFANDELRWKRFSLQLGLRVEKNWFLNAPVADDSINLFVIPVLAKYWETENAHAGEKIRIPFIVSPRIGFTVNLANQRTIIRGGIGIFSGRMPLAWPGGVFRNNGIFVGGFAAAASQLNAIRFRADPYKQWTPKELFTQPNKEPLDLVAGRLMMPALYRTSVSIEHTLKNDWLLTAGITASKNITEIKYTNINLLPATVNATGPDNRKVYSIENNGRIPLYPDGTNPYDHVILLSNYKEKTGAAYDFSAGVKGRVFSNWFFETNYRFGHSTVMNDGTNSVNLSQWRSMENINGRNFLEPSLSDFSLGHRVLAMFYRAFTTSSKKATATISLIYTGKSGSPVSYVYSNYSIGRDDGLFGTYDLIYIPTQSELSDMVFLSNNTGTNNYTPEQQKDGLEKYISSDSYLSKHRGNYAERNGSRTPFTHIVDLRLIYNIRIKTAGKQYRVEFTYDIFNITNLINRTWGHRYFLASDNIALIEFAGYASNNDLRPRYRFDPGLLSSPVWPVSGSITPMYSARWSGKMGIRITF